MAVAKLASFFQFQEQRPAGFDGDEACKCKCGQGSNIDKFYSVSEFEAEMTSAALVSLTAEISHSYLFHLGKSSVADKVRPVISALYRFSCTAVDAEHRRRRFQAHYNNQHGPATDYYYSPLGRTSRIAAAGRSVDYAYVPKSNLLERRDAKVGLGATGTKVLSSTHLYDAKGNLTDVQNMRQAPFNVAVLAHHYGLDALNRREVAEREDGTHWTYGYDSRSQVTSGKKYLGTGPLPGMQNEYEYDNIGNRLVSKDGGNITGGGLRTTSYVPNALNQYTNITRSDFKTDFVGTAGPSDVVSVNGTAAERAGPWWRAEVTPSVGSLFGFGYVELNGQGINGPSSNNLPLRAPAYPTFTSFVPNGYDADGNLLSDGRQTYVWDGENRLIEAWAPGYGTVATFHLVFAYDSQSRRIWKKVFAVTGNGSQAAEVPIVEERYLYDGWNLAVTLRSDGVQSAAPTIAQSYIWGPDLSGSLQGAGGVGGLLMTLDSINAQIHFPAYDGNGNLMVLVRAETGTNATVDAAYEYDPFGRTVRATGPAAQGNPFRFSTKFTDDETGLVYYGYRYYDAMLGRWLSRDPIAEQGGVNIYGMVENDNVDGVDVLGLSEKKQKKIYMLTGLDGASTDLNTTGGNFSQSLESEIVGIFGYLPATVRAIKEKVYFSKTLGPHWSNDLIKLAEREFEAEFKKPCCSKISFEYGNFDDKKTLVDGLKKSSDRKEYVDTILFAHGKEIETVGPKIKTGSAWPTRKITKTGKFGIFMSGGIGKKSGFNFGSYLELDGLISKDSIALETINFMACHNAAFPDEVGGVKLKKGFVKGETPHGYPAEGVLPATLFAIPLKNIIKSHCCEKNEK